MEKQSEEAPQIDIESSKVKVAIVVGVTIAYVMAYSPLSKPLGNVAGILAVVPVITVGWAFGFRYGLLAGMMAFPINSALVILLPDLEWRDWASDGGVLGTGALILVGGVVGRLSDLTANMNRSLGEHERMEEALRDSQTRLRLALEAAAMTAFEVDRQTGEHTHYGALQQVFGLGPSASGMSEEAFIDMVHPEDREWLAREDERVFETGNAATVEFRVVRPDGEVRWIEARSKVIYDSLVKTRFEEVPAL